MTPGAPPIVRWAAVLSSAFLLALAVLLTGCQEDPGPPWPTPPGQPPLAPAAPPDRDNERDRPGEVITHEDARDETPPGVSAEELKRIAEAPLPSLGERIRPAGAQSFSCPRHIVRNHGSRGGKRPLWIFLHFTVSPPGSIKGIRRQFDTRSSGSSSTFGMELTGRCEQWVPFDRSPWTQLTFNRFAESVEIVTYNRTRAQWLASPMIRNGTLAALVRQRAQANGIPLRLVDPRGCPPGPPGITDHDRAECGNSHWDVGKNFPWDVFMRQVQSGDVAPEKVVVWCRKVNWYRNEVRLNHRLPPEAKRNAEERLALIKRARYSCAPAGPVRV